MSKSTSILLLCSLLLMMIVASGTIIVPLYSPSQPAIRACTKEAKLCPDGKTYVGRMGLQCEFAKCPEPSSSPFPSSSPQVIDTSNWKTYRNEKYGFSFQYPNDWDIEVTPQKRNEPESKTNPGYLPSLDIFLSSKHNKDQSINIDVSDKHWWGPDDGDKSDLSVSEGGTTCATSGWHVVECTEATSTYGVPYTRIIEAGQSVEALYRMQSLKVYMLAPQSFLQFDALVMDADGTIPRDMAETTRIFDGILSTFGFVK